MTKLTEKIARLTMQLKDVAQDIQYLRGSCPVSQNLALCMKDYAEELDDFSLAIDIEEQESTRH